jgi:hypothetical protein
MLMQSGLHKLRPSVSSILISSTAESLTFGKKVRRWPVLPADCVSGREEEPLLPHRSGNRTSPQHTTDDCSSDPQV